MLIILTNVLNPSHLPLKHLQHQPQLPPLQNLHRRADQEQHTIKPNPLIFANNNREDM